MDNIYMSELIATRLSHDLVGNAGAVLNALELIDEGDIDDDIKNLLRFSAETINKRLKFFRLCFGLSNKSVKDLNELECIIRDYLLTLGNPNTPIAINLKILNPEIYKIVLPAVMMMADVIIKGGLVSVSETDSSVMISATSEHMLNIAKLEAIETVINGMKVEDNPSAYAPLFYLIEYLKKNGLKIKLDRNMLVIGA